MKNAGGVEDQAENGRWHGSVGTGTNINKDTILWPNHGQFFLHVSHEQSIPVGLAGPLTSVRQESETSSVPVISQ